MQEEDFGDGSRRKAFDRADSHTLKHSRSSKRCIAWRCSTPHRCSDEKDAADKINRSLAIKNGSRRGDDTAHAHAHHVKSSGECHFLRVGLVMIFT